MTKQEALKELGNLSIDYGTRTAEEIERLDEAVDMAIKAIKADALERQTCDDAVSRQAAIDALNDEITITGKTNAVIVQDYIRRVNNRLHDLPAVQPEPKPDENGSEPFGNAEMLGDRTTDDCISRQAAIETLNEQIEYCNKALGSFDISPKDEYAVKVERASLEVYKEQLENLPSAQPEMNLDEWCTDCKEYDHEKHCCPRWNRVIRQTLKDAQPELIRCRDCKFQDKGLNESESWNLCGYRPWLHVPTEDEHYCGYAKRRTEE